MQLESLKKLYLTELKDVYSAENQILAALPKMIEKASNQELKSAFGQHLEETRQQVERLDQIFDRMGEKSGGKTCEAMKGLVKESQELIEAGGEPDVLDAALIAAAQKVEHYEISSYGTLVTYANMLDQDEDADLLQSILDEEYATDDKLTALAETVVNIKAQRAGQ